MVNNGEVKQEGEEINWVRFCKCDLNDKIRNPIFHAEKNGTNGQAQNGSTQYEPGLIMLLGYNTGIQAWYLQGTNEAREVLSIRNGLKCRTALILPTPANDDQTGKQVNCPEKMGSMINFSILAGTKTMVGSGQWSRIKTYFTQE